MYRNSERGAVTIFLSIILLAMIVLTGILIDGTRIRTGGVQVKRAVENAVKSALAGYDYNLKEQYGIFALYENNSEKIKETVEDYINENLITKADLQKEDLLQDAYKNIKDTLIHDENFKHTKFLNLYDYKLEKIRVTPIYNLTENEVTKNQIVEYMKYRAPKELADGFVEKMYALSDTEKITEITEFKMDVDKLYIDINEYQKELYAEAKKINQFQYKAFTKDYVKIYSSALTEYNTCLANIKTVETKLDKLKEDKKTNALEIKRTEKKLKDLKNESGKLLAKRRKAYDDLCKYIDKYRTCNKKAKDLAFKLKEAVEEINKKINSLRQYLNKEITPSSSNYLKQYETEIKISIDKIEKALIKEKDASDLTVKLEMNTKKLEDVLQMIGKFDKEKNADNKGINAKLLTITEPLQGYNNSIYIQYKGLKETKSVLGADPRNEAKKRVKNRLKEKEEKTSILKEKIKSLPSYKVEGIYPNKTVSRDFLEEDEEYINLHERFINKSSALENDSNNYGYKQNGMLEGMESRVDFDTNSNFLKDSFEFVKNICSILSGKLKKNMLEFRNEIYFDEYIMGTFNNAVPILKNGGNTSNDLRGRAKDKTINNEVEYILFGNTSETVNLNMVKGQLLLLRFAIDTANIYRDPEKVEAALAIASVTGGWSFGLAVPAVQNLILAGWGMLDAINDVDALLKGEAVPLFSKFEDKETNTDIKKELTFSYHDYLRVFLLIEPSEQKINRVEDLIQLKTGKRLSNCNTYLRVEAEVSMKYLFITQAFMPKSFKTADGLRHKFKVVLYQGY